MDRKINILEELAALDATTVKEASNKNVYFLPDDYFDGLASGIMSRIFVESIPVMQVFSVPENYFQTLPDKILDRINNASQLNLNSFKSQQTFSVPDNYFNNLSTNILNKIKDSENGVEKELEEIAPFLNSISKANVYSVPEGYFKNLPVKIPDQTIKKRETKVVSLGNKTRKWIIYAAAACIIAVMSVGGFSYLHKSSQPKNIEANIANINVEKAISQLSDNEISNYLTNNKSDFITQPENVQDVDIQNLIENTSDEEIENYLKQNAEPGDGHKGI